MVWLDITKGLDSTTPNDLELLDEYQSFLEYYANQSVEL